MKWTKSYCGVQHIDIHNERWQFTLSEYATFVVADVINKTSIRSGGQERVFKGADRVKDAKKWLTRKARSLTAP